MNRYIKSLAIQTVFRERNLVCANFLLWDKEGFLPYTATLEVKIPIVLILNGAPRIPYENRIYKVFNSTSRLKNYFSGIQFHYCNLDKSVDTYYAAVPSDESMPEYGWKSGPNLQFFHALSALYSYGGYTLLLEPDVLPVRNGWLELADFEIEFSSTFWVKGSKYLGKTKLVNEIATHLNGVAIYYTGSDEFQTFLSDKWKPLLKEVVTERPFMAYDACLFYAKFHTEIMGRDLLSKEDIEHLESKFITTPFVQNHTGKFEKVNQSGIPLKVLASNPDTCLLHGKHLFRELVRFGIIYNRIKNKVRDIFENKTIDSEAYNQKIQEQYEALIGDPPPRLTVRANDAESRILDVMLCPFNAAIPRVKDAGIVKGNKQVMHNGLEVYIDSYYPWLVVPMLELNKGVHEPEEEAYFLKVLKEIKNQASSPLIIELGCYWAFYSLWFLDVFPDGKAFLIEPDEIRMAAGKRNFELNEFSGDWTLAKVGRDDLQIDAFVEEKSITEIDILHSDIQGAEVEMLLGAEKVFKKRRVKFTFISTHSNDIHKECLGLLKKYNYHIIYDADMSLSRCFDGVIVASRDKVDSML